VNTSSAGSTSGTTGAIILAAGLSRRLGQGQNKLLLPLGGKPVLAHVLTAALGSRARPIVLVLGHQADLVREAVKDYMPGLRVVENPAFAEGQSTSLRIGLATLLALPEDEQVSGAIFLLGDQPLITASTLNKLLELRESSQKQIVLPLYQGQRGNPVLFARELAEELLGITGDDGGRSILKRHPEEIATLELGTPAANLDVDTWEAYEQVREQHEKKQKQMRFWLDYSHELSATIRYEAALAAAERAMALDAENVEVWYAQGTYLAMLARYEEAHQAFQHALSLQKDFVPAWDGEAWVLGILGKKEEALAAVNRALELDPDYFDALKRKKRLEAM
jgi:molybdenum cofactor cytidylyltransferase